MIKKPARADYVAPILERTALYMQEHPEKFEHIQEKGKQLFWQNTKKVKGKDLP